MTSFEEGYDFFAEHASGFSGTYSGSEYVSQVNAAIEKTRADLNDFSGFRTDVSKLKGDIAEFWHAGSFNADAAANNSGVRLTIDRSHEFASADLTSSDSTPFGLKFYQTGVESAKQQAKSVFERFQEYKAGGGTDSLDKFLADRGYLDATVLNDPVYKGQVRIIPKDQYQDAVAWLQKKIEKESVSRPEQVARYKETLALLSDRAKSADGTQSIPLSEADARRLAALAKEGAVSTEDLKKLGLSTEDLITCERIFNQALQAGVDAAMLSIILKTAPEIYKAIQYLVETGKIDGEQLKKVGLAALSGGAEGFVRGSLAAAITTACQSGLWGEALKSIEPPVIGCVTVIALNIMKNACRVARGEMEGYEMANALAKELFLSSCAMIAGGIAQMLVVIPALGFMLGSFVGSVVGAFTYDKVYSVTLSFCADTGFTLFGLVKQDYRLPDEVFTSIGMEPFKAECFKLDEFVADEFTIDEFHLDEFEVEPFEVTPLQRGVIGVSRIGYVAN